LALIELEKGGETAQIDLAEKLEELDTMLGVFGEVLVDHVESALENGTENAGNILGHQALLRC